MSMHEALVRGMHFHFGEPVSHDSEPVGPVINAPMPKKFESILSPVFSDTITLDSFETLLIQDNTHNKMWDDPVAVTYIFSKLRSLHDYSTAELIIRKDKPHHRINCGDKVKKDARAMATVIDVYAWVEEEQDKLLSSRSTMLFSKNDTKYNDTSQVIGMLNGLVSQTAFHEFLNTRVNFDTQNSFKKIRALHVTH